MVGKGIVELSAKIQNFNVADEMEDYEISLFFDEVSEAIEGQLSLVEKEMLLNSLFEFLKRQDPEMEENFSFIHLIEGIDEPDYKIYDDKLLEFNNQNASVTAILLLNRHANGAVGDEREKCIVLLKSIADNIKYTDYIREVALDFFTYQLENKP